VNVELNVEKSLDLAAPPSRVWQAWTQDINRWWVRPYYNDAARVTGLRFEPFAGGRFVEEWGPDGRGFLIGHILEWLPPERLAYTWTETRWKGIATLVILDFQALTSGGTRLKVIHTGFERLPEAEKMRQGYAGGLGELLARLQGWLETG
jgi:uncharacterized protein YndB with AHSA1/START domain